MALGTSVSLASSRAARYRRVMESLRIRSEHGRTIPMRFSQSQEIMWAKIRPRLDERSSLRFVVLKARQVYASTFFQNLTFVRTIEQPGAQSLVIAHDLDTSHELFAKSKMFYDHLPLPSLKASKVKTLEFPFPHGTSRYTVISAGTVAKGRGTTQTCMHLSECAFWPHAEVITGLLQAMPDLDDTILAIESTANGMTGQGEMFFDLWNAAVRGDSDLEPIFIPFWSMPKYRRQPAIPMDDWDEEERLLAEQFGVDGEQLAWRRKKIATSLRGSVDRFRQEFPASPEEAFIVSGQPAFDKMAILRQRAHLTDPVWRGTFLDGKPCPLDKGEVRVWDWPQGGHQYVIGADTAEGFIGGDYSCAEIIDMATLEQVASIHGHIGRYEFAALLNQVGRFYHKALLCIEVYPQGHAVQDYLIRNFQYPTLHRWRGKPDRIRSASQMRLYGWETNVWSRPLLIEAGQRTLNRGLMTIHEQGLLDEILRFSRNDDGKYEASAGHDDRVLALLLALRSREENYTGALRVSVPQLSEEAFGGLPTSLRVLDTRDVATMIDERGNLQPATVAFRKRVSRLLKESAERAVKTWMEY